VNGRIHDSRSRAGRAGQLWIGGRPHLAKTREPLALTLRAGPVPGRQRSGFIQEEQFGVVARRHQVALPAPEVEQTDNPTRALVVTSDDLLVVMQAAAIASQRSSC
jgi:hypothetical protein